MKEGWERRRRPSLERSQDCAAIQVLQLGREDPKASGSDRSHKRSWSVIGTQLRTKDIVSKRNGDYPIAREKTYMLPALPMQKTDRPLARGGNRLTCRIAREGNRMRATRKTEGEKGIRMTGIGFKCTILIGPTPNSNWFNSRFSFESN